MIHKAINPPDKEWKYQHKIADQFFQDLADATELILSDLQEEIDIATIEEALKQGKPAIIIDSIDWSEQFEDKLLLKYEPVYNTIMALTGAEAWKELSIPIAFNIRNPYSEKWIAENAANMVTLVTKETKQAIRRVILDGFQMGFAPRQMAKPIREMIGLTERDSRAVLKYWAKLNEEADLSARRVDNMANTYEEQLLRERALTIARTETINAANRGIEASWQVARDGGYILPETQREWIAAAGSCRTCKICMDYNGRKAPLDGPYVSPKYGEKMGPPGHVCNCRCSQGLVTK